MSGQPLLLPSLYALLPTSSYPTIKAHLSLLSLHVEPLSIAETTYLPTASVIPNQIRPLRLQATLKSSSRSSRDKGKGRTIENEPSWEYGLAYVSAPLQGREYSEMSVRGYLGVEVSSSNTRRELETWVEALGYKLSHRHARSGLLFHLPLPEAGTTLHLSITRLAPPGSHDDQGRVDNTAESSEPYLVELRPAKPQQPVPGKGEVGIQEMMRLIKGVSERIDGLQWGSGR